MLIVKAATLIDTYTFVKKNTVVNYNSQHNKNDSLVTGDGYTGKSTNMCESLQFWFEFYVN